MKKPKITLLLTIFAVANVFSQNVGIGTNSPDNSAKLAIQSSDKGILIPNINIADLSTATPVTSPANSLLVYNTNSTTGLGYFYWDGTKWVKLTNSDDIDFDWYKAGTTTKATSISDYIYTNGRVGIGDTDPHSQLTIKGDARIRLDNNINYQWDFNVHNTNSSFAIEQLKNNTNAVTRLKIDTFGNVGIGTSNPTSRLHVSNGRVVFSATTDANGTIGSGVLEIGGRLRIDGNEIITNTNSILYIQGDNNGDLEVDGGTFFVDASKNHVGVGTSSPQYVLDVEGNEADYATRIFNSQNNVGNLLLLESNGGNNDDTLLLIRSDINAVAQDEFIILGGGQVGINHNNPNPLTHLDVNGYMIAKSFFFSGYSTATVSNFGNANISFSETNDPNNNYDGTTYTAPVDGYYQFSTNITFTDGDGSDDTMLFHFMKNGNSENSLNINPKYTSRPGKEVTISNSTIIHLVAGDLVNVKIDNVNGTPIVDYNKRNFTGFFLSK